MKILPPLCALRVMHPVGWDYNVYNRLFQLAYLGYDAKSVWKSSPYAPDACLEILPIETAEIKCFMLHDLGFNAYIEELDDHYAPYPSLIPCDSYSDIRTKYSYYLGKYEEGYLPIQIEPMDSESELAHRGCYKRHFDFGTKSWKITMRYQHYDARFIRWVEIQVKILERIYMADMKKISRSVLDSIYRYHLILRSFSMSILPFMLETIQERKLEYLSQVKSLLQKQKHYRDHPNPRLGDVGVITVDEHNALLYMMIDAYRLLQLKYSDDAIMDYMQGCDVYPENSCDQIKASILDAQLYLIEKIMNLDVDPSRFFPRKSAKRKLPAHP